MNGGGGLTDESPRGTGAGAATARFAMKLRASKVGRPAEESISWAGMFPMSPAGIYMGTGWIAKDI